MNTSITYSSSPSTSDADFIQTVILPSMNMMLLATAWSATLLPLLFALFFFSTKALRRKPVFIFNVISILLGIGLGVMDTYYLVRPCFAIPIHADHGSNSITYAF